jgi:hypothetical protein
VEQREGGKVVRTPFGCRLFSGLNVGGEYPFKRLLTLDWPAGKITEKEFDAR